MPGVFLVIGRLVPVCHQQKGLHERDAINLVVKVVQQLFFKLVGIKDLAFVATYPSSLKEDFPSSFPARVTGVEKMLDVNERSSSKHDSLEQQQAHPVDAIVAGNDLQELLQVQEGHVRMHIVDVGLEQLVAQGGVGDSQGALGREIFDVVVLQALRQTADVVWEEGAGPWRAEQLLDRVSHVRPEIERRVRHRLRHARPPPGFCVVVEVGATRLI